MHIFFVLSHVKFSISSERFYSNLLVNDVCPNETFYLFTYDKKMKYIRVYAVVRNHPRRKKDTDIIIILIFTVIFNIK